LDAPTEETTTAESPAAKRERFTSVFDQLIQSNLELTLAVKEQVIAVKEQAKSINLVHGIMRYVVILNILVFLLASIALYSVTQVSRRIDLVERLQ